MTKHHWRKQMKSFFESHADPDKHEQLKQSKKEMEEKKDKIIKLIRVDGSNVRTESLEELIKDYHKQYESLYDVHLNLTGELKKKAHSKNKQDKEKSSSSSSDSDKESSSKGTNTRKSQKGLEERIIELEESVAKKDGECSTLQIKMRRLENENAALQTAIDDLKRDVEMDKDELATIEEKNRNLEVTLRLSNQKQRVAEQLLSEKEASHKALEEALSRTLEEYGGMIRGIAKQFNASLAELEFGIKKRVDGDCGGLVRSVIALCEEVESVRRWVAASRSEEDVSSLALQVEVTRKTADELEKAVKEKEERILSLGEEKREAIRQLCVLIEYYRSRCVELQGVLLKNVKLMQ